MLSLRLTTNSHLYTHILVYIPTDLPVCQATCSFNVSLLPHHEDLPVHSTTGLYTQLIYWSMYTQTYVYISVLVFLGTCALTYWSTLQQIYMSIIIKHVYVVLP